MKPADLNIKQKSHRKKNEKKSLKQVEKKGKDLEGKKRSILKGFLIYLETKTEENRIMNKLFLFK